MSEHGWELVASDEPKLLAKPLFDTIMMKDGQSDGCLTNPVSTNESNWGKIFGETNNPLDQLVTPETGSGCWEAIHQVRWKQSRETISSVI